MSHPDFEDVGSIYVRIAEEAGEVVKAAMKCERFGPNNRHPEGGPVNEEELRQEIGDLLHQYEKLDQQERDGS